MSLITSIEFVDLTTLQLVYIRVYVCVYIPRRGWEVRSYGFRRGDEQPMSMYLYVYTQDSLCSFRCRYTLLLIEATPQPSSELWTSCW